MTVTGHPCAGLTVAYGPLGQCPARPEEIINKAAKVGTSAGIGAGVATATGVMVGKFVFGTIVTRAGVASASIAFRVPILATVAIVGGILGSVAYGIYRFGKWRHQKEVAEDFAKDLIVHIEQFNPSCKWPSVEIYVSVPEYSLSALWQPVR